MKVIVAGCRWFSCPTPGPNYDPLHVEHLAWGFQWLDYLHQLYPVTAIVCGKASGADTLGEQWAIARGIPVIPMPADWDRYGKRAGYLRNEEMAAVGEYLVAFWDGESKGTGHMIRIARNLPTWAIDVGRRP